MDSKERAIQEVIGSLTVDEIKKVYDIQYVGPANRDPGFLLTIDGEQIPFTDFDDIKAYLAGQADNIIWDAFVPNDDNNEGNVIRDRVKHIELIVRITHTDA